MSLSRVSNQSVKEKRILHVSTGLGLGGAESLLYEAAIAGKERGYQPIVISLKSDGKYAGRLREIDIPVFELGAVADSPNPGAMLSLRSHLRANRPHIVQAWMYHANLFSLCACFISGISPAKHLIWGIFTARTDMNSYGRSTALAARLGARMSGLPAGVLYNAKQAASDHASLGYHPREEIIIHNGIDIDRFRPDPVLRKKIRENLRIPDTMCVAIIAARNHPQKDWTTALAGVSAIDGLITLAVGEGTELLEQQPGLIRLGAREDMTALYAAADFFLLPSAYGEGTSVAMCEAMACGLPVIVTDVGDNAKVGVQAGLVAPVGDSTELRRLVSMMVEDRQMRETLGMRARDIITSRFSRSQGFAPLLSFYDSLTSHY